MPKKKIKEKEMSLSYVISLFSPFKLENLIFFNIVLSLTKFLPE